MFNLVSSPFVAEGSNRMQRSLMATDVNFLCMQSTIFCVQCELLSENNTPHCLACGSTAVLSLARLLGGSLRGQRRHISSLTSNSIALSDRCFHPCLSWRRLVQNLRIANRSYPPQEISWKSAVNIAANPESGRHRSRAGVSASSPRRRKT